MSAPTFTVHGTRYDGVMMDRLHLWTILDGGKAHGTTIALKVGEESRDALEAKIAAKHQEFGGGAPVYGQVAN